MVGRQLSTDPARNDWLVNQIATLLDDNGTSNILHLYYYSDEAYGVSFFGDYETGHVYENPNPNVNSAAYNAGKNGGNLFWTWSPDGREIDNIYLFFTKDGYPVFWNQSIDNGSTWADVRGGILFIASVVLSVVGVPLASSLGTAVVGTEIATAYPALANAVGQTLIGTLLNGGDIEKAAISSVASFAGAGVGAQVVSTTGVDVLGQVSAAATRAYITNGDVTSAVGQTLLRNGVSSMQSLLLSGVDDTADFDYDWPAADSDPLLTGISAGDFNMAGSGYYTDENGITYGLDAQGDLAVVDYVDDQGIGYYTDSSGDVLVADAPTTADLSQTDNNGSQVIGGAGGDFSGISSGLLTGLATTALQLVGAYVKAGAPAIRAGSATTTVNANGTITTRNPTTGQVQVTRPAAGTPYVTSSGSVVTNNGDGTYTTISANGSVKTMPYSTTPGALTGSSLMSGNTPLYLGLAAVAAIALTRR